MTVNLSLSLSLHRLIDLGFSSSSRNTATILLNVSSRLIDHLLTMKSICLNWYFVEKNQYYPCKNGLIVLREERRVTKWRKMIGAGGSDWKHYVRRKPHVVKRRIRKGIPDCLRGLVWQLISGSRDLLLMNPGVYEV